MSQGNTTVPQKSLKQYVTMNYYTQPFSQERITGAENILLTGMIASVNIWGE